MFRTAAITLTLCLAPFTAQAALLGRSPLTPGGADYQAYYDDVLGITWLADANYAQTSGYDADGLLHRWAGALEFTAYLNGIQHLGVTTWRLPKVTPINGVSFGYLELNDGTSDRGYNIGAPGTLYEGSTASEMAHLFYNTLGNLAVYDPSGNVQIGWGLANTGPFANFPSLGSSGTLYWTGTPSTQFSNYAFTFTFSSGRQNHFGVTGDYRAWAVADGDALAVVPVPPAAWLFGSALGVMGWMRRKVST